MSGTQRQRHRTFDDLPFNSRPALQKLTRDVEAERERLFDGFESNREILEWAQSMTVRTLGQIPDRVYEKLAHAYRTPVGEHQSTVLAALLTASARDRDLSDESAAELRQRLYDFYIHPAYHDAFRQLRKDASEYHEETWHTGDHEAALQSFTAMRPAIDELRQYQERVLEDCLAGLPNRNALVDWADEVELATHGEIDASFETRIRTERTISQILIGEAPYAGRARQLFAAYWLLPAFNAGVRDIAGRAAEQPRAEREDDQDLPRWD